MNLPHGGSSDGGSMRKKRLCNEKSSLTHQVGVFEAGVNWASFSKPIESIFVAGEDEVIWM